MSRSDNTPVIDPHIADLLGIDLADPQNQRDLAAIEQRMRLIDELVRHREARGLSVEQVAERSGLTVDQVADFERVGGDPYLSTVQRYGLAVGVDFVWLLETVVGFE